jgi:hypothetical protein
LGDVGDLVVICRIEIKLPFEVTVIKKNATSSILRSMEDKGGED